MRTVDPDELHHLLRFSHGDEAADRACPEAEPKPVAVAETATHSRYPGDFAPMMDIHGPQRRRVMFSSPENGYPGDAKKAVAYLVPGRIYSTVSVEVGSSRTNVELAECPGVRFNSVHFIDWPPVAEPEQPTPSEPVIDEAVFSAARTFYDGSPLPKAYSREQITAAVLKDRELRRTKCGGSSERSSPESSSTPSSVVSRSEPDSKGGPTAPAADPRLTDEEISDLWRRNHILARALRAVADAQLEKARVTISLDTLMAWSEHPDEGMTDLIALLRRHGVGVTP